MQLGLENQIADLVTKQEFQLGFQELKTDVRSLRQESKQDLAILKQEFQLGFQELKNDIQSSRQEARQEATLIRQEMQKTSSDLEMRLIKYIFAQGGVVIGTVITALHFLK